MVNDSAIGITMIAIMGIFYLITFALSIVAVIGMWKTFVKAGKPGWACLVPIYNIIILLEIAEKELWWIVLLFIPVANIVIHFLVDIAVAEKFGKSSGFGVLMALFPWIGFPILGFGEAQYQG
jgi:hypothetical protein